MKNNATKFFKFALTMLIVFVISYVLHWTTEGSLIDFFGAVCKVSIALCLVSLVIALFYKSIYRYFHVEEDFPSSEPSHSPEPTHSPQIVPSQKTVPSPQTIGNTSPNTMVYKVKGVRGRHLEVYEDRCVLRVSVTIGSIITGNFTDGEKIIYYVDCIGTQFKKSGILIGYLQLETASNIMNHRFSNFFNENAFTFDKHIVSNEQMQEITDYIRERVSEAKSHKNSIVIAQVSSADELKKFKDLLDDGVITQEEFDAKKKQLLGL